MVHANKFPDITNDMMYISDNPMHMCFGPAVIAHGTLYYTNVPKHITFNVLVNTLAPLFTCNELLLMYNASLLMHNRK